MRSLSISPSLPSLLAAFLLSQTAVAKSTSDWKSRSIYQVMTDRFARTDGSTTAECVDADAKYCGGSWRGMIDHLDYVQGMGFDALYISPVTEGLNASTKEGENYHGYWATNLYELNSNFGTADDLRDLAKALHDRGMWLMSDAAINDFAAVVHGSEESDIDYSGLVPFNSPDYYHPYCPIEDYSNYPEAQRCWLGSTTVALPDFFTEKQEVLDIMSSWIIDLVQNYSIDGLRLDAAKHVDDNFLKNFAAAPNMYTIGEVYEANATVFCHYQDLMPGMTNYPNYFAMIDAFTAGNISTLANQLAITKKLCADTTTLASFSENHDLPRVASYTKDTALLKTIIAWTILSDGVPMIYQGQEQAFSGNATPINREALWKSGYNTDSELYQFTKLMNGIRKQAITVDSTYVDYTSQAIYTDGSTIVLRKGNEGRQVVAVLSNSGKAQTAYNLTIPTAYVPGELVMDITTCTNTTINEYAQLIVPMDLGEPHIFFPANRMNGSQICGMGNWSVPLNNGKKGPGINSAVTMDRNLYSSSIAVILAIVMTVCLF